MPISWQWGMFAAVGWLGVSWLLQKFWLGWRSIEKWMDASVGVRFWVLLLAFALGGWRYQATLPDFQDETFITNYINQDVTYHIRGVLIRPPDIRDAYTNLWIETTEIRQDKSIYHFPIHGKVVARTFDVVDLEYGDVVVLKGELSSPPAWEGFSYRDYLMHKGVYAYIPNADAAWLGENRGNPMLRMIYRLKERALAVVYQIWSDPQASLFAGILLGEERGIPQDVANAFQDTGTTHIIAISGFNISIVAGLLVTLFGRLFNRMWAALAAGMGIFLYTIFVGADAAVVRAAIMGGLSLLAVQFGQRQHGINSLAIVAAVMTVLNPHVLWDVGFQLSFTATLGLILYAQPLQNWFVRIASKYLSGQNANKLAGPVGEYILFTLAAQVTTLPVILYHFQRLSVSSLLVNPLILPAQPPVMTLGGMALLSGLMNPDIGRVAGVLAEPFIAYTIRVVEIFSHWQGGVLVLGEVGIGFVLVFYGLLFGITAFYQQIRDLLLPKTSQGYVGKVAIPLLLILGGVTIFVWRMAMSGGDGLLHLTFLNVGSGDAILITTPSGRYTLINGGPSPSALSDGLGRRMAPHYRQLDWLIVGSVAEEDIAALPSVVERFPPENVLWAGLPSPVAAADRLRGTLNELGVPVVSAEDGQWMDLGSGAHLDVVAVSPRGAVLVLEMRDFRAVFPVGISLESMQELGMGQDIGSANVLLLAEHGYEPANPPEWLQYLNPQLIILSVAPDDPEGLPDRELINRLQGYTILRTDHDGWIQISTDGKEMWIETEH